MASHRYCLPLSRRRLDFEPLQVDEDGKEYTGMSSGWREREREREEVSFFHFLGEELSRKATWARIGRSATNWSASLVQSRWVYAASTSAVLLLLHTHIEKACAGLIRSLLCWMDNIPKGLARLLRLKTSVRKWRTALIYFYLYFFGGFFFLLFHPAVLRSR